MLVHHRAAQPQAYKALRAHHPEQKANAAFIIRPCDPCLVSIDGCCLQLPGSLVVTDTLLEFVEIKARIDSENFLGITVAKDVYITPQVSSACWTSAYMVCTLTSLAPTSEGHSSCSAVCL